MIRSNTYFVGAVVMALACAGCAGKRVNKVSERDLPMPVAEAIAVSKDVMNDYGFDIQVIDREDGSARLEGDHLDGQDVAVEISPLSNKRSHVKIKVTNESPRTSAKTILNDIAVRYE